MHQLTSHIMANPATAIAPTRYIYTEETFLNRPPIASVEAFARQGKELVPAYFSFNHNPGSSFVPVATPTMKYNYGSYIYNSVTGYQ